MAAGRTTSGAAARSRVIGICAHVMCAHTYAFSTRACARVHLAHACAQAHTGLQTQAQPHAPMVKATRRSSALVS